MGGLPQGNKKKKKETIKNYVSWFEIPAIDFQQAVNFYNHIFGISMEQNITDINAMAFFPATTGIGGGIVAGQGYVPSDCGPLIYLNGGSDLNNALSKVEEAGGRIIMSKTLISEDMGYFAIFIDSQGNKLALYSKD
ncbi:MAG: VOC family protein [Bacteroidetes bacterium]|nr:VOC family protein [Bacteroidota bacterium]MBU1373588.1 VOC family protein [Bacteroidota bacterium]MBU1486399.1 VOC family protein [Bacteroidota bacterium]MBU1759636.1 VOC family protein [Bacteroidota bacterium]MBU2045203.1 VOC family protein [Bacteroidota bacterium]